MRNFEKYWSDIKYITLNDIAMDKRTMKICKCSDGFDCNDCLFNHTNYPLNDSRCGYNLMDWLNSEYVEPEQKVDWNKVKVDTPILVRTIDTEKWKRRYFAKYENGNVYAWMDGATSWSSGDKRVKSWNYCKLAEDGGDDND